jgi:hypothetical protein
MTRRERIALGAALLAIPVAIVLVVLAVDVLRTPGWISSDDARFQSAPIRSGGLWNEPGILATRTRIAVLGLGDDLAYRRTVALFSRLQPGGYASEAATPEQERRIAKLQFELTTQSRENPDVHRRSRLQNLMGVLLLSRYLYASPDERNALLTNAIGSFRSAVELDPANDDAKLNLELALRAYSPILFPSNAPDTGGAQGEKSGHGRAGSGY